MRQHLLGTASRLYDGGKCTLGSLVLFFLFYLFSHLQKCSVFLYRILQILVITLTLFVLANIRFKSNEFVMRS
jgi:hypothetical protein